MRFCAHITSARLILTLKNVNVLVLVHAMASTESSSLLSAVDDAIHFVTTFNLSNDYAENAVSDISDEISILSGAPTDDVKDDGHAPSNGSVTTFYRRKHIDFILKLQQTEITKKVNQQSAACEGYTTRILCAKGLEGGDVCTGDSVKCQQQKKTACTHFLSLYCVSFIGRTSVQVGLELCD